jgi:hypothetical protein
MVCSHLLADTLEELHSMAERIGCERGWYQVSNSGVPHYDIPLFRRARAVELGAVEVSGRETVAIMARVRLPGFERSRPPRVT